MRLSNRVQPMRADLVCAQPGSVATAPDPDAPALSRQVLPVLLSTWFKRPTA